MDFEERNLRDRLHALTVEYRRKAWPLMKALAEIESEKSPRIMMVDLLPSSPAYAEMQHVINETMRKWVDMTGVSEAHLAGKKPEAPNAASDEER